MTATKDDKLGEELAELARQLLLWLKNHDLPGIPELAYVPIEDLNLYAGTYHRFDRRLYNRFDPRLLPKAWANHKDELSRLFGLGMLVKYVLLVENKNDDVTLPDGRVFGRNRIVAHANIPIDKPGGLITVQPSLGSRTADDKTMAQTRTYEFSAIANRVDLVWDDMAAGKQALFRFPFVLDYTPPRREYEVNVKNVPIPQQLERRDREFREHLYTNATYHDSKKVGRDEGGDYYQKWREKAPLNTQDRQFQPSKLSDEYLKECFTEFVMKEGDTYLLIDLPHAQFLYRLLMEPPRGNPFGPPRFTVQLMFSLAGAGAPPPGGGIRFPVEAVIFRAIDGAGEPPRMTYGKIDYRKSLDKRHSVDYKAYVRWYYGDEELKYRNDSEWLDAFMDVFFADQSYPMELTVTAPAVAPDREKLFLGALREEASQSQPGPIKDRLNELIAWCDDKNLGKRRYVLTQGMMVSGRQVIGVSPRFDVYEWNPDTKHVTVIQLTDWLTDNEVGALAADIYENTAGMLPFITLVTWGGVIVMTGGVVGVPVVMTNVARSLVKTLVTHAVGSAIAKNAAAAARRILMAELIAAAMSLVPKNDNLVFQFIHGVFEGFGGGAAEHYLSETDERVKRAINQAPRLILNHVTKNGYQAILVFNKVRVALVRIAGVIRSLRVVLTDKNAKLIAEQLNKFSQYAGTGFLVVVFVVIYLDWAYRSRWDKNIEDWVKKQQQTLKWMVETTGNEIADIARDLREELVPASGPPPQDPSKIVRKYNQRMSGTVTSKLRDGVKSVPAVADYLEMIFERIGIRNWNELKNLGITDVMERGVDALAAAAPHHARKLGEAVGELIGTIMLERKIVSDKTRAGTGVVFDRRQSDRAAKTMLAGGTWRALLEFAIHPFAELHNLPASLKRGLEEQGGVDRPKLTRVQDRDTAFRDFIQSLIGNEEELTRRLAKLAADADLEKNIRKLVASAAAKITPPTLGDLLKKHNDDWPADAVMFLLYTWLRVGVRHFGEMFDLLNDDQPYGKVFKLADLLDILGLDLPMDDQTLASLRATFVNKQ
ncbi:hypothetical protein Rhe02_63700 [Rhizocola hellebori]|uniref:Uncharacterized protein n=1 Tax=Rhizocola hellebori TaxID=1392758 RepID=A0A8J3QES9_9ACTN|nr:hypothetical protein [Rhizocola hellebori]GIH08303.1 hypothetical protein Rhe02_63700 [Rhizocola hellebori]